MIKLVLALIALVFMVTLLVAGIDFSLLSLQTQRVKHHLNASLHAASLVVDKPQLAEGKLELPEPEEVETEFAHELQANMKLNEAYAALPSSYVPEGTSVTLHELLFANENVLSNMRSAPSNCTIHAKRVTCQVTAGAGTDKETTRTVDEIIAGPSIIAVIEVTHDGIGLVSDEPIVTVGVQEVLWRK